MFSLWTFAANPASAFPASDSPPGRPLIDAAGRLLAVFTDEEGCLHLASVDPNGSRTEAILPRPGRVFSPQLAKDRRGGVWAAWTEEEGGAVRSRCAEIRGGSLGPVFTAAASDFQFSPSLDFDASGEPWLAFAAASPEGTDLVVVHPASGRSWTVVRERTASFQCIRLAAAPDGTIWVFWTSTGSGDGREDVFGLSLHLGRWSPARRLANRIPFPRTGLDAASGPDGTIWLAWAEYDGQAYRIMGLSGGRGGWGSPVVLSASGSLQALSPSLAFIGGADPAVCWTQTGPEGGAELWLGINRSGTWAAPVRAAAEPGPIAFPRMAEDGGRLGFVWLSRGAVRTASTFAGDLLSGRGFDFGARTSQAGGGLPAETRPLLFNPDLSETAYIAFGDSITQGQIGKIDAPDKGYPPRLDILLDAAFGPTAVINEGLGGEFTAQGLIRMDSVIPKDKARYLLLLEGTNDTKILEISMDTAAFNLKEMLRKCLAAGMLPAISTLLPRYDPLYYFPQYINRFNQLNASIRLMAAELAVPLIDLYAVFVTWPESDGGVFSLLSDDVKHPSEKGYQVMAEKWAALIRTFPFPAESMQGRREYDKILFARRAGALLTWTRSSKVADASAISGYRIYRRREGEGKDMFRLLTTVTDSRRLFDAAMDLSALDIRSYFNDRIDLSTPESLRYFDTTIDLSTTYEYVLTTIKTDGMEGPCSTIVRVH